MSLPRPIVTGAVLGFLAIFGLLRQDQNSPLGLAHFFLTYVKADWLTYVLLGYLWPIAACLALLCLAKRRPDQARQFNAITEFLLFLVVVSTVPGLLLALPSSAAYYFSNVSIVVGLAALAAFSPLLLEREPSGREWLAPLPAAATLALFIGWSVTMGAFINALYVYREAVTRRVALFGLLAQSGGITPMMALLGKLGDRPFPIAVWRWIDIPSAREDYWKAADCSVAPFVMPRGLRVPPSSMGGLISAAKRRRTMDTRFTLRATRPAKMRTRRCAEGARPEASIYCHRAAGQS